MIPLVILPIVLAGRRQQKLARANQDRIADASAIANETLNATYAVQAYAREQVEVARYDAAIGTLDQLVNLAQVNRVQLVVPRLQPTVKWPPGRPPQVLL